MGGGCAVAVPWVCSRHLLGTPLPVIYERRGRCRGIVVATVWDLWDRGTYFEGPGDFLPPVATTFMGPGGILRFLYQQWYNGGYFCQAAPARHQCPSNTVYLGGDVFQKILANFSKTMILCTNMQDMQTKLGHHS